jgi:hypothetical protein
VIISWLKAVNLAAISFALWLINNFLSPDLF